MELHIHSKNAMVFYQGFGGYICIQCKFLLGLISAFVRLKVKLDARFKPLAQVTLTCLRRSGVFIVNFKHISHLFLVFLLMTWNK